MSWLCKACILIGGLGLKAHSHSSVFSGFGIIRVQVWIISSTLLLHDWVCQRRMSTDFYHVRVCQFLLISKSWVIRGCLPLLSWLFCGCHLWDNCRSLIYFGFDFLVSFSFCIVSLLVDRSSGIYSFLLCLVESLISSVSLIIDEISLFTLL